MRRFSRATVAWVSAACVLGGGLFAAAPALAGEGHALTGSFLGEQGAHNGEFKEPDGVAVSETGATKGDVYVVDEGNNRVEWFNAEGKFEGQFNGSGTLANEKGKAAPLVLSKPEQIAVDNDPSSPSRGDVYVLDPTRSVLDKFSATGEYEGQLAGYCENPGETALEPGACAGSKSKKESPFFGRLGGVAVDPTNGVVWISGEGPFTSAQVYIFSYSDALGNEFESALPLSRQGTAGTGLAVDSEHDLYVGVSGGGIAKTTIAGEIIGGFDNPLPATNFAVDHSDNDVYADDGTSLDAFEADGELLQEAIGAGELTACRGVAVDAASNTLYAADAATDKVDIFTKGAQLEKSETLEAKGIATTTAVLYGRLKPPATKVKYYFRYKIGASCLGGARTPAKEGEGEVSEEVKGLDPNTDYTFCVVSENKYGQTFGNEVSLLTLPAKPEVVAGSESVSSTEAFIQNFTAEINPESEETSYRFEYSIEGVNAKEELEGEVTTLEGASLPAEFGERRASVGGVFICAGCSIYYRVVATNGTGTAKGKVQVYTKLPIVANEKASALTSNSVKLEATVNPDFRRTEYRFEYATSEAALEKGEGTKLPGGERLAEEPAEPIPVSVELLALQSGHTYYYRVVAENETSHKRENANKGAPIVGEIEPFEPYAAPVATTGEAQDITGTTAVLSGEVNPEGAEATYYFAYIDKAGYERALAGDVEEKADPYADGETTAPLSVGSSGNEAKAVAPVIASGLVPGETYDYALVATNKFGERGVGGDETFTTLSATPPIVSTGGVSGVSQNSARLSGTVSTNGLQTNYGFEIATEPDNYGPATGLGSIGGSQTEEVSLTLGELQPGTTYYYRVMATNADGASRGEPGVFTTPGFPILLTTTPSLPVIAAPSVAFPEEETASGGATTKTLTSKEKLGKALKACKRNKSKSKRVTCEKQARQLSGGTVRKKKKK